MKNKFSIKKIHIIKIKLQFTCLYIYICMCIRRYICMYAPWADAPHIFYNTHTCLWTDKCTCIYIKLMQYVCSSYQSFKKLKHNAQVENQGAWVMRPSEQRTPTAQHHRLPLTLTKAAAVNNPNTKLWPLRPFCCWLLAGISCAPYRDGNSGAANMTARLHAQTNIQMYIYVCMHVQMNVVYIHTHTHTRVLNILACVPARGKVRATTRWDETQWGTGATVGATDVNVIKEIIVTMSAAASSQWRHQYKLISDRHEQRQRQQQQYNNDTIDRRSVGRSFSRFVSRFDKLKNQQFEVN